MSKLANLLVLVCIILSFHICEAQPDTIFFEDFTDGFEGWEIESNHNLEDVHGWHWRDDHYHPNIDPPYMLAYKLTDWEDALYLDTELRTPYLDCSGYETVELSFDGSSDWYYDEEFWVCPWMELYVYSSGPTTGFLMPYGNAEPFDINMGNAENVKIEFVLRSSIHTNWALDNVLVQGFSPGSGFGQQQIISTNADGARSVFSIDLDDDGDNDVLSASSYDDKIAWYENYDGLGSFSEEQVISTDADGAISVYSIDLDGDGDNDVLSASTNDDKIAWYENTDGQGSFGDQRLISLSADSVLSIHSADLDGDGDNDVLSAYQNRIAWQSNTNGLGDFGPLQVLTNNIWGANSVFAVDFDGDDDMDVLAAGTGSLYYYDNQSIIAWFENYGEVHPFGRFSTERYITYEIYGVNFIHCTDVNGNGVYDVVTNSELGDIGQFSWFTNYGWEFNIAYLLSSIRSAYSADIDLDGDIDLLSAESSSIKWYENTHGIPNFEFQEVITTDAEYAQCVYSADLDGDGYFDVISASRDDDKIAWYRNRLYNYHNPVKNVGYEELPTSYEITSIYPNPFNPSTNISVELPATSFLEIRVFNIIGQQVTTLASGQYNPGYHNFTFDGSNLSSGIYFIQVTVPGKMNKIRKVVLLK